MIFQKTKGQVGGWKRIESQEREFITRVET